MKRRAATAGVAAAVAAAAAVVAVRRIEHRWRAEPDPCGDDGLALPDGRSIPVITDDGAALAVTEAGEGPLVVLAHCYTGSRQVWAPVARRLVAGGHRVVLYDQRGHGESTVGSEGLTIDRLGDDLRDVLVAVDAHDAVLVGHSMGGMTVMALVGRHPEVVASRAAGLVLVATAAGGMARVPGLDGVVSAVVASRVASAVTAGLLGPLVVRATAGRRPVWAHLDATARMYAATDPQARAKLLRSILAMDLHDGLARCPVPAVVVVGNRDRMTPAALGADIVAHLPNAELVVLPDGGHMLPFEQPDRLAELIAARTPVPAR